MRGEGRSPDEGEPGVSRRRRQPRAPLGDRRGAGRPAAAAGARRHLRRQRHATDARRRAAGRRHLRDRRPARARCGPRSRRRTPAPAPTPSRSRPGRTRWLIPPLNQNDITTGDLDITDSLAITGRRRRRDDRRRRRAARRARRRRCTGIDRLFEVLADGGAVSFSGLTLSDGLRRRVRRRDRQQQHGDGHRSPAPR